MVKTTLISDTEIPAGKGCRSLRLQMDFYGPEVGEVGSRTAQSCSCHSMITWGLVRKYEFSAAIHVSALNSVPWPWVSETSPLWTSKTSDVPQLFSGMKPVRGSDEARRKGGEGSWFQVPHLRTHKKLKIVTCSSKHSRSSTSFFNLISKETRKTRFRGVCGLHLLADC